MKDLAADRERRKAAHLYRRRRIAGGPQGVERTVDGAPVLAFCSNDYLGLAGHPQLVWALQRGAESYGAGSGAAHLVTGHTPAHHALEEELAELVQRPRALLFSTGYMANLGAVAALAGRGDAVLEDRLNHASLLDAGLLSGARLIRYRHADAEDLARRLARPRDGQRLVLSDGVFSMDGDLAPLPELAAAARSAGAWLMVDDAHGLGVLGARGRGSLEHFGLGLEDVPVLMGTLGKAFGTFGAFVAGSDDLVDFLIQTARTYIYSTAPPPALAEATRAALRLVQGEPWRRQHLEALVARFRRGAGELGLPLGRSTTPIQPLVLGSAERALAWQQALEVRGILISAIRPPTVPKGAARLRITFSAAHTEAQVDRLLGALEAAGAELGAAAPGTDDDA
ncbi:MAG: 8-amino-7-oxononanoate synthase [Gammaproteobacteria bacterium]|nr:8-amino-7-oxononanoate synthase [Gammaproteobacteria bacterium]